MGEHRLNAHPIGNVIKDRWEANKSLGAPRHRYVWRSTGIGGKGTMRYKRDNFAPYGPLTRREYKNTRKFLKQKFAGDPKKRYLVMSNLIGVEEF